MRTVRRYIPHQWVLQQGPGQCRICKAGVTSATVSGIGTPTSRYLIAADKDVHGLHVHRCASGQLSEMFLRTPEGVRSIKDTDGVRLLDEVPLQGVPR